MRKPPLCCICEYFDAYPNRPTCAYCDPKDQIKFKTDPRVPSLQTAYRLGGVRAVLVLLGHKAYADEFEPEAVCTDP